MVNVLHRKIHPNVGLGISKVVTKDKKKKFEDVELQALSDEYDSQTQKQLTEQLDVSQQVLSNRPREMGKIQKTGRWVPHESNDRQM